MTTQNKLLIQCVVDNCATMKGEKITKLADALSKFGARATAAPAIEYSLVVFDALQAKTRKNFTGAEPPDSLSAGGLSFLNKALGLALNTLEARIAEVRASGAELFKPWLILLTDGKNVGDMSGAVNRLNGMLAAGRLTYFPFQLGDNDMDDSLSGLLKIRRPLSIIGNRYAELADWIFNTAKARVDTPISQAFSLDPKSLEGWVKR
ncbi:MAG: hypothetical protein LBL66_09545 [Clostridiales bacterium]|jgi:uncharacterized protein YegL|nr:hypothetical protein [Clostridiales bacterium]